MLYIRNAIKPHFTMKSIKTCALIGFLFISSSASAQLLFKNQTDEPVWVTYAMWIDSKTEKHWYTQGWWKVEPGQTKELSEKVGLTSYCYYYAETKNAAKKYDGNREFLVNRPEPFLITNADKEYQAESNSNYSWENFRKYTYEKDLLGTKIKQTIVLEY